MHPAAPSQRPDGARLARLVAVASLASSTLLLAPAAHADMQTDLCQGAASGCGISLTVSNGASGSSGSDSLTVVGSGLRYNAKVTGNPSVSVQVQFFAIEFNSEGKVTGLVPASDPVTASGGSTVHLHPRSVGGEASGWGFVGLADSTSTDLRTRVGAVYEFSGLTLKTLGDGFADLKPVDTPLEMWTLGNVRGVGYWVEYQDVDGVWRAVPGQGYTAPQRLMTTPGEISALSYSVPSFLESGRPYQFRVNSHLNFSGPTALVENPQYTEWTVVPSGGSQGTDAPRGDQLNPGAGPGLPDPTATPAPTPDDSGEPSVAPAPAPTAGPGTGGSSGGAGGDAGGGSGSGSGSSTVPAPTRPSSSGRPQQGGAGPQPATSVPGGAGASGSSGAAPSAPARPSAAPSASASPTPLPSQPPAAGGASPSTSPAPGPSGSASAAPVWGNEAATVASTVTKAERSTSMLVLLALLCALAAPAAWAVRSWLRSRAATAEVSA